MQVPVNINLKMGSRSVYRTGKKRRYWDQDNKGYFAGYKFVFINDSSARAMSVQSGDTDVALDCAVSDYSVYDADPNVQAVLNDNGMVSTILPLSLSSSPCLSFHQNNIEEVSQMMFSVFFFIL